MRRAGGQHGSPQGPRPRSRLLQSPRGAEPQGRGVLLLTGTAGTAGLSKRKAGKARGALGVGFQRHLYS